jgi:hypothetical protein
MNTLFSHFVKQKLLSNKAQGADGFEKNNVHLP